MKRIVFLLLAILTFALTQCKQEGKQSLDLTADIVGTYVGFRINGVDTFVVTKKSDERVSINGSRWTGGASGHTDHSVIDFDSVKMNSKTTFMLKRDSTTEQVEQHLVTSVSSGSGTLSEDTISFFRNWKTYIDGTLSGNYTENYSGVRQN